MDYKTPRQQVIISRDLRIRFADKCLKERLIPKRTSVKITIEILMEIYNKGILDSMMPKTVLEKSKKDSETRVQLNRKLKEEFGFRAYEKGLISDPQFSVRAIELLMNMYLDGKIKINRDE